MVLIFNKFFDMPLYRYVKEHPDAKIHGDDDDDDDFDMGEIKEYRQLLQGQDKIHDVSMMTTSTWGRSRSTGSCCRARTIYTM